MNAHNDRPVQAGFARRSVFTALKDHDVMGHKEVYQRMGRILASHGASAHILDIGCGDCADIFAQLTHRPPAGYVGVDSSAEALANARELAADAPYPVRLLHGDYQEALTGNASFDIIWMGLFLHHLPTNQKRDFLPKARALLKPGGMLLAHDPLLREGEDRSAFIERLEAHGRRHWPFLTADDLDVACRHWSEHGHQESLSTLRDLAVTAGFLDVTTLWSDPGEFYSLLCVRRE